MSNNLFLQKSKMVLFNMTIIEVSGEVIPYQVSHVKLFSEGHSKRPHEFEEPNKEDKVDLQLIRKVLSRHHF